MMAGLVVVLLVLLVVFNVLYLLYWALDALGNPYVTTGTEALLLSFTICPRSLASAAEEIYTFLIHHHLGAAREKSAGLWAAIRISLMKEKLSGRP